MRSTAFLLACLLVTASGCTLRTSLEAEHKPAVAWNAPPGTSVNVMDYGADPTGRTDCAPAFEAAFRAALPRRGVHVLLPPGRFLLRRAARFEILGNAQWTGVHFDGAGQNVTQLIVDNDEGGLFFQGTNTNRLTVELSGFSLVARRNGAGSAVRFDKPRCGVKHNRQFMVRNIEVRGETFAQGFFRRGFDIRNVWFPYFSNVTVGGRYGPSIPDDAAKMEFAFHLLDCYNPKFLTCHVWNGQCGLYYGATTEQSGPEDGTISNCYFVGNERGIVIQLKRQSRRWEEPGLHITDCHINYRDQGIVVEGLREATISLCLFYCNDRKGSPFFKGGPSRDFTPVDVDLVFAGDILITHNIFTEPSNPKRIAVRIGRHSGNILIAGNQFNIEGTAIRNESRRESYSSGNFFKGRRDFSQGLVKYADLTGTLVKKDLN